jgi:hypothetical protein
MEKLFLKLMDLWVKVRTQNFTIKNIFRIVGQSLVPVDTWVGVGPVLIEYVYNGRIYKHVSQCVEHWPPDFGASRFVIPIKKVMFGDVDVTQEFREQAGPRQNGTVDHLILTGERSTEWGVKPRVSFGKGLTISLEFFKKFLFKPRDGVICVTNILGQTVESTVGAR